MELRLLFDAEEVGKKLKHNMDKGGQMVRTAMQDAAEAAAEEIKIRGREDIAGAGNFGGDWQDALHVDVTSTQRTIRIETSMQGGPPMSYWSVFEYGKTIFAHNPKGLLTWPNTSEFSIDGVVPAFISKESVTIPKKFHLTEIIAEVSKELRTYYAASMRIR
jgi:hypothetical protein